jgi:thiosulfate/3-mercaptopyruvate sulfurtransferase
MLLTLPDVEAIVLDGSPHWRLVDGRAEERYRGEVEPIDRVAGHIPGAVNVPYLTNLAADGGFRTPSSLAQTYRGAIGAVDPGHVVCYCGSGVTACHSLLAMAHAGLHGAKLYAGSWSEWSADERRPVERSEEGHDRTP